MFFVCPECSKITLKILSIIELPADNRSDEIRVQIIECMHCPFTGVAIYEESRRGSLDSDSWEHSGYSMESAYHQNLKNLIRDCPSPEYSGCDCATHQLLRETNQWGRWQGIKNCRQYFPMRREL